MSSTSNQHLSNISCHSMKRSEEASPRQLLEGAFSRNEFKAIRAIICTVQVTHLQSAACIWIPWGSIFLVPHEKGWHPQAKL